MDILQLLLYALGCLGIWVGVYAYGCFRAERTYEDEFSSVLMVVGTAGILGSVAWLVTLLAPPLFHVLALLLPISAGLVILLVVVGLFRPKGTYGP